MATLDIFNNDAFSVSSLTQTIVDLPRVPTLLGDSGLFQEYGIPTLHMMIERQGSGLKLVPTAPRGGVGQPVSLKGRKLITVSAVHLPQTGSVLADEVQGIRAFGSETEVETVQALVARKIAVMKGNLDLTLEYHRVGALQGLVLDADGSTILDLYDRFDMVQETVFFDIETATTTPGIKQKHKEVIRAIRNALGGRSSTGVRALVSEEYFDMLTGHDELKAAYDLWQNGQYLREQQNEADFAFAGITYQVYSGGTDGADFIPAGKGYAYPTGVPDMFQTAFAPADYMETVNTMGVPYYAKQELMRMGKGVELESQSNPITLNTLPEVVIELDAAAS